MTALIGLYRIEMEKLKSKNTKQKLALIGLYRIEILMVVNKDGRLVALIGLYRIEISSG